MPAAINILFGALFTVATSWALGTLLIRRLELRFHALEERLLAFVAGSACLSEIMFVLATLHLVRKGVLLVLGAAAIALATRSRFVPPKDAAFTKLGLIPKWVFLAVFSIFTALYFFNGMAPEMSPDGSAYHLGMVARYYQAHGFVKVTTNIYANLSEGVELLFYYAFVFGKHSAAALVHVAYFVSLVLLVLCYGRRIGYPVAGIGAAIFVYASPIIGIDGSVAYIDVALAAILFALFYLLQVWDEQRDHRLLAPIGILTGFAYAAKYTAFLAVPYALGFVFWKLWRAHKPVLKPVFLTAGLALLFILPWTIKNWIWVANPFAPFANRLFPNPYVHISFEEEYRRFERIYSLTSYRQLPWQLTVKGELITGFFGPLFLLTPVALLSLRSPPGRQLLLAGTIFALPYAANVGARFLIPAAPFLSLSLALAFTNLNWLILILALAHAVSCWPGVAGRYCGHYAWRLGGIPFKAALRIEPEDKYLSARFPEYNVARMLERIVPAGEEVFALPQVAEAYTSRRVLVRYEGAFNEVLNDILWNPIIGDFQATSLLRFQFPPRQFRKLRVVQTARATTTQWSVAEVRVFRAGVELPRSASWRLTARPNPWDVQLAFDNTPVTRWRSWQVAEPGMYIEIDFGHSETIDAVSLESSHDNFEAKVRLDAMDQSGKWTTVSPEPSETTKQVSISLRLAAAAELKARGIRYLLVSKDDIGSGDYRRYSSLWGMKCVGESGGARLYYIE